MKGLILVYALTAAGAVGALRFPVIGLYVYVCFAILRPHFLFGWAGNLNNISQIVGIAMLIGWAMNGFGTWHRGRGRSITVALVLFVAWVWMSATQALNPPVAYTWGIEALKILGPFLVGVTMLNTPAQWRILVWIIVGTQGYVSAEMNLSYLRGINQVGDYGYGGMDNNSFGISLVATLGPAFMLAITEKSKLLRGVATVCGAAILHTILLTFSRGAFLGLLVVGAMAFLMLPKRPVYVLAMIAALLLTVRLVGPQLASRYSTTFVEAGSRDASAASRVDLWRDCLDTAIKNPIFGVGPRNWPLIASSYGWPAGKEAHSVWMQTLAETGFVGVSLLAFFFGATIVLLWPVARARIAPENRLEAGVATGVVLAVVGFAVAGQFVSLTGLETPYYMTLVGVVLLKSRSLQAMTTVVAPPAPAQTPPAPITIRIPPRARLTPEPLATRRSTG